MKNNFSIKKVISAALAAVSFSASASQFNVRATERVVMDSADWDVVYSPDGSDLTFQTEADADEMIKKLADERWKTACAAAVKGAGADGKDFIDDQMLSNTREVFTAAVRDSYFGKRKEKTGLGWGVFGSTTWKLKQNTSMLERLNQSLVAVVRGYMEITKCAKNNKSNILLGNAVDSEELLNLAVKHLDGVDGSLDKLDPIPARALRELLFGCIFGGGSDRQGMASWIVADEKIDFLKNAKVRLNERKTLWETKIRELRGEEG